jgi:dTDP-4-amino-4,6-dideoxygalactose transaminase
MVRSGGTVRLVDAGGEDFLMNEAELFPSLTGEYAVVLCEVYGHTYDLSRIARQAASPPVLRVADMAMALPHPALFERLGAKDFAVLSFGTGSKPMFAGWGAMGITRDQGLADEVRKQRDAVLARGGFRLALRRVAEVTLRTLMHYPALYPLAMGARSPLPTAETLDPPSGRFPPAWADDRTLDSAWRLPSTYLDRGLALRNLEQAGAFREARLALARRYQHNLEGAPGIVCPRSSPEALSHYTVRVAPSIRLRVKQRLYQAGIYVVSLWTFYPHLDKNQFPNAFRLSSSVLNLPLSPWLSPAQVDHVCETLIACVAACSDEAPPPS